MNQLKLLSYQGKPEKINPSKARVFSGLDSLKYNKLFYEWFAISTSFTSYAISSRVLNNVLKLKYKLWWKNIAGKVAEKQYFPAFERKQHRINNILSCSKTGKINSKLYVDLDSRKVYDVKYGCNSKLCPNCVEKHKKNWRGKCHDVVKKYKDPRFMTVSFKNVTTISEEYLVKCNHEFMRVREQIRDFRLWDTFSKKKRLELSKKGLKRKNYKPLYRIDSYINVMEIKRNYKGDAVFHYYRDKHHKWKKKFIGYRDKTDWNMHYHIIYDGSFINQRDIRKIFYKVTKGESHHIDLQWCSQDRIHNRARALNYITKYISKMIIPNKDVPTMIEYYNATFNKKFIKVYSNIGNIPQKRNSKMQYFKTFIYENNNHDSYDARFDYFVLSEILQKYKINQYELDLSPEENFFKYGSTEEVLKNLR